MYKTSAVSLFLILLLPFLALAQLATLQPVWETDTTLHTAESVLFHPGQQVLYVSCINGPASPENKTSYIAKVSLDGKVIQLKFVDKLNVTKGMGILADKLYVTELTQIAQIDLGTGNVLHRYPIEGAQFLNDIAVDPSKKTIYVTDSKEGKIWALADGKINLVASGGLLSKTNGLRFSNGQLLVGNGDGALLRLNPITGEVRTVAHPPTTTSIDGIIARADGTYLINEVAGKLWYVLPDGTTRLLLDTSSELIKSADTDYDPAIRLLFMPTLHHNTVRAYQIN